MTANPPLVPAPRAPREMATQHLANAITYTKRRLRALRLEQERRASIETHPFFVAEREQ